MKEWNTELKYYFEKKSEYQLWGTSLIITLFDPVGPVSYMFSRAESMQGPGTMWSVPKSSRPAVEGAGRVDGACTCRDDKRVWPAYFVSSEPSLSLGRFPHMPLTPHPSSSLCATNQLPGLPPSQPYTTLVQGLSHLTLVHVKPLLTITAAF